MVDLDKIVNLTSIAFLLQAIAIMLLVIIARDTPERSTSKRRKKLAEG